MRVTTMLLLTFILVAPRGATFVITSAPVTVGAQVICNGPNCGGGSQTPTAIVIGGDGCSDTSCSYPNIDTAMPANSGCPGYELLHRNIKYDSQL